MKKSFILYYDQSKIFNALSNEQAGQLIKCLLNNGHAETIGDGMVQIAHAALSIAIDRDNEKYEMICERNRINGLLGGRPRNPENPVGSLETQRNPDKPRKADSDSDSDSDKDTKKKNKQKEKAAIPPDWLEPDLISSFIAHRNKLRKPMTEKAKELFFTKLTKLKERGFNHTELIETAIERGWQTVFEPDLRKGRNYIQDGNVQAAMDFVNERKNQ